MFKRTLLAIALLSIFTSAAQAETWSQEHPRRAEVVRRDKHQISAVDHALTAKKLTYQQGSAIKARDAAIRHQEQHEAKVNGGFITRGEQRQLNREENGVRHEIRADERKDR